MEDNYWAQILFIVTVDLQHKSQMEKTEKNAATEI
jgi:hypothetical protein